jgi:ABC-type amino acid transport system permease subunit
MSQRAIEIWGSMPELYLLIIFASIFEPSLALLIILLSLFGWMGLSDYVRAEFYRNRSLDYVKSARALGLSNVQIMWRHILPNSLTPVITFLPFRMSAAILALTSLDFLGLGVPPTTPSLGELLAQGKANLDAWWISLSTFAVLVLTLLLLTFMGDALRDAFDTRMGLAQMRGRVAPKVPARGGQRRPSDEHGHDLYRTGGSASTGYQANVRGPPVGHLRRGRRHARGARSEFRPSGRRALRAGRRIGLGQDRDRAGDASTGRGCALSGLDPFRGRGSAAGVRSRDAPHSRVGDRHDLPGAHDGA